MQIPHVIMPTTKRLPTVLQRFPAKQAILSWADGAPAEVFD